MKNSAAWRASLDRRQAASEILQNETVVQMLATLELDHPMKHRAALRDGFDATYRLGFIEGYDECLAMLRALGDNPPPPRQHIASTFGSEGK